MKICNYYKHGGVERHHNGSFTMYGTVEGITDELVKMTYFDYTFENARKHFKEHLKKKAEEVSMFINQD